MALDRQATTASHWSANQYQMIFSNTYPKRIGLVTEERGAIQGFLVAREADREWELENIIVAERAQRKSLGTALMQEFLKIAQQSGAHTVFLEVRKSNLAARTLYRKFGFVETGSRPGYYHDPEEEAVTYRLVLS